MARSESFHLSGNADLKRFSDLVTQIFGNGPNNLSGPWVQRNGQSAQMKAVRGVRWNHLFNNCDVAIRHADQLKLFLDDFNRSNEKCKELRNLMSKNHRTLIPDLISTSLIGRAVMSFWESLTKRQTKRSFLKEITNVIKFNCNVQTSETLLEYFKQFYDDSEIEQLEDVIKDVNDQHRLLIDTKKSFEALINYITKSMKPNHFSNLDSVMDPTNIRIEQCFGELKFLEHKFERLTISNLLGKVNYQFHFIILSISFYNFIIHFCLSICHSQIK